MEGTHPSRGRIPFLEGFGCCPSAWGAPPWATGGVSSVAIPPVLLCGGMSPQGGRLVPSSMCVPRVVPMLIVCHFIKESPDLVAGLSLQPHAVDRTGIHMRRMGM